MTFGDKISAEFLEKIYESSPRQMEAVIFAGAFMNLIVTIWSINELWRCTETFDIDSTMLARILHPRYRSPFSIKFINPQPLPPSRLAEIPGGTPGENLPPPFVSRCEFDRYQRMHIKKSAFPSRPVEGRHWRDDLTIDQCKVSF